MPVLLVRVTVLYAAVIALLRLMGKRQIGELQPSELVVTLLISELASLPMQNREIPVLHAAAAMVTLVALEMLGSVLSMKSRRFRTLVDGRPVPVICNGKADPAALRALRMTTDDLEAALRQKDVFRMAEVAYAVFETNGQLSVQRKERGEGAS